MYWVNDSVRPLFVTVYETSSPGRPASWISFTVTPAAPRPLSSATIAASQAANVRPPRPAPFTTLTFAARPLATARSSKVAVADWYWRRSCVTSRSFFGTARQPAGRTTVKSPTQLAEVAAFALVAGAAERFVTAGTAVPVTSTVSTLNFGGAIATATGVDQAICFADPGR